MHSFSKRVGYCLILLTVISVFVLMPNVDAKQKKKVASENDKLKTTACENALFSGNMFTVDKDNQQISINAKEGKWNIKYVIENDVTTADYSLVLGTKANPTSLVYTAGSALPITVGAGNAIFLVAEPQSDSNGHIIGKDGKTLTVVYKVENDKSYTTTCKAGNVSLVSTKKIKITNTAAYISQKFKNNTTTAISYEAGTDEYNECKAMKEGKYKVDDTSTYFSDILTDYPNAVNDYVSMIQKSFPYCFSGYTAPFEVNSNTIKKVRQKSLETYKEYLEFTKENPDNSEYTESSLEIQNNLYNATTNPSGYRKIEDLSKNKLSCDKKQTDDKTARYYTEKTEVDNGMCKVICREQLEVIYSPPVATKAGLCIDYKVTVKSKVTCQKTLNKKITWPEAPTTCGFSPECSDNEEETQAGPTEEFDSCINECDGGKYSQSCINSCYKKVYGSSNKKNTSNIKKTTTQSLIIKNNTLTKLANKNQKSDPYYSITGCTTNAEIRNNVDKCAKEFYKLKQKYPLGSYEKYTGSSDWIDYMWVSNGKIDDDLTVTIAKTTNSPSADNWIESVKRASPYYFRNKDVAAKTLKSFYGVESGLNGYGEARTYIIDNDGIKRQSSPSYFCGEICGYRIDGSANCKKSSKEIKEYYVDAFDVIYNELSNCNSKAVCEKDTAKFNINVDYETEKENKTSTTTWDASNETTSNGTCIGPSGQIGMFIPIGEDKESGADSNCSNLKNGINGICYGKDNINYWQDYKTTISFPGTWTNLKTGKKYYKEDEKDTPYARFDENLYCVGYDYKDVNVDWGKWKFAENEIKKGTRTSNPYDINSIEPNVDDNIEATITNFGKYGWNIKLNCFYAIVNEVIDTPETPETECSENENECNSKCSTKMCNASFRPVDQQNLFPAKDGVSSRAAGFNWTSAAKDTTITNDSSGYGIDPGLYAKQLQDEAKNDSEAAYKGTADYTIHLTKENLKALKSYAKQNGYTNYDCGNNTNCYKPVEGVDALYYYTSQLLTNNSYVSTFNRTVDLGVNNN